LLFSPDYSFVPVAATPVRESWQGGEGRGCTCHQSRPVRQWLFPCSYTTNSLLQSVYVHAVLGGGGPRWQPFNGADHHVLLARRQSERALAGGNGDSGNGDGGNGDGGRQLRLDDSSTRPLAGTRPAAAMASVSTAIDSKFFLLVFIFRCSNCFCNLGPYSYVL
jgi:hypothetical protein